MLIGWFGALHCYPIIASVYSIADMVHIHIVLVNPHAHAPQSYSSWVRVSGSIIQTVMNRPGRPTDCLSTTITWFKTWEAFAKIQNSSGSRVGAPVGHFACPRRRLSVYPFTWRCSRPHGVFVMGFAFVFGATQYSEHEYLHHWMLTSTTCNCSPEGRYDPI